MPTWVDDCISTIRCIFDVVIFDCKLRSLCNLNWYSMGPSFIIHFVILLEECKKWDIYDGASTLLSDTLYWATCLGLFMSFTHHQHWVSLLSTFFFFFLWIHASVKVRFSKYLVIKYSFSSMLIVSIFNNKRNGKRKSLFATTAQNIILTHST